MGQNWIACSSLITPRRYDLAIKWRFFSNLSDPDARQLYIWHIWQRKAANAKIGLGTDSNKADLNDYLVKAYELCCSMKEYGFDPQYAIPVDPDGEILGGAHRLACAIALGFKSVPVGWQEKRVWAPTWDRQWFVDAGVSADDLARLDADWMALNDLYGIGNQE